MKYTKLITFHLYKSNNQHLIVVREGEGRELV